MLVVGETAMKTILDEQVGDDGFDLLVLAKRFFPTFFEWLGHTLNLVDIVRRIQGGLIMSGDPQRCLQKID